MTSKRTHQLDGFDLGARRAIDAAHEAADSLGHSEVGTEHLLLGLLDEPEVASVLQDHGATSAAARRKVREAVPARGRDESSPELALSARGSRAVGRAPRFARDLGATLVGSDHLLLAVLDVEGTAGQVLRGLGVDIAGLRIALSGPSDASERAPGQDPDTEWSTSIDVAPPRCPQCHVRIEDVNATRHRTVAAAPGTVEVISCPTCAVVLGIVPG